VTNGGVWVALPLVCLTGGAFALYLVARLFRASNTLLSTLATVVFGAALVLLLPLFARSRAAALHGTALPVLASITPAGAFLRADPGALVLVAIALGIGGSTALYSGRYIAIDPRYATYYPLLLLMVAGMMGMVMTTDLFNFYMFCELMSIAAYVLVAFRRHTDTAIEAGFKYLIMGSVGTIIMLMGIAFIYRETGQLTLPLSGAELGPWQRAGSACFVVGLGLKSAIVPLHTWLPDAYGRAPSSISAVLASVISKSTLYMLPRIYLGLGMPAHDLGLMLIWLAFLNMTLGNALALMQTNTKRLLAYSSIAQTGYIMFSLGIGLRYDVPDAIQAAFFLLLTHAVMKATAFLSKGVCHFYLGTTTVEELRGTAVQLPLVAVTFSLALGGLAGVPPLAGFVSKWFILAQALHPAEPLAYVGLIIFLLNSLLALGYYLPLIARLFTAPQSGDGRPPARVAVSPWMAAPLIVTAALIIAIGVSPGLWLTGVNWMAVFWQDM